MGTLRPELIQLIILPLAVDVASQSAVGFARIAIPHNVRFALISSRTPFPALTCVMAAVEARKRWGPSYNVDSARNGGATRALTMIPNTGSDVSQRSKDDTAPRMVRHKPRS